MQVEAFLPELGLAVFSDGSTGEVVAAYDVDGDSAETLEETVLATARDDSGAFWNFDVRPMLGRTLH